MTLRSTYLAALALLLSAATIHAQKEFGFDNSKPSGQPYLKPEESVARMKVADGFEVKLFAAEPLVCKPVAMTVDEKGRVWVIECFEYPKRTQPGKMPRDRIVILEDTTGSGVADKRTVFAEGKDFPVPFDLATGLEVGNGGVYVGAPPYLFFIENKNDKPGRFDILLKGFGSQDTHETLNTFQWGPDGRLYGLHGVFTQSDVKPSSADGPGERLNAAVWRYDTRTKKFETFAEGTSNPWGMDWRNSDGQFILCCCVIPHLFHISPGGNYKRQAGQSFNPHAYGEIKEICDHTFHKESGWAHAGLISLDTPLMPEKYRQSVIFGSIHGCSIKQNVLEKNGSTYLARRGDDFLVSGDKNFRPINLRWGPNGEIYCIDWHDQNPCHQAAPNSWNYEHGRVYRLQPKGLKIRKAEDLGKKTNAELRVLVGSDNPYINRTALRLLQERRGGGGRVVRLFAPLDSGAALRETWLMNAAEPWVDGATSMVFGEGMQRRWNIRAAAESPEVTAKTLFLLTTLARTEADPSIRLELACAALRLGSRLDTKSLLHVLLQHKEDAKDPVIPQILWLAYDKQLDQARTELDWLRDNAAGNPLVTDVIVPRTLRRLASGGKPDDLAACVAFLRANKDVAVTRRALEGMVAGLKGQLVDAPPAWPQVQASLLKEQDPEVLRLTQTLAINFRDVKAAQKALATVRDTNRPLPERLEAARALGLARLDEARQPLLDLLGSEKDAGLRGEVVRALGSYEGPEVAAGILKGWKDYPPSVRVEAVNVLAGRKEWAGKLLEAVGNKSVPRTDLTDNTILRIRALKDRKLDEQIKAVWGQFRDTPANLNAVIDNMRGELYKGSASFEHGRKVFETQCAKCHIFEGKGNDVGPQLDGAGRDIEYLLVNVLDPNRVVGAPYFQRFVTLKNGRVETGLLAAEDENTLTLKGENNAQKVIPKKTIESIEIKELSLMPEGLDKNMTVQDFRDLVRYVMQSPYLIDVEVVGPLPEPPKPGARWTSPVVGVPGRIPLPASKGSDVTSVRAHVMAPAGLKTRLLLGSGAGLRVMLNGKVVYEGKPGADQPDRVGVDVSLQEGANELLIEARYVGAEVLYARFLDPERKLRYPEPKP
jgi:putative membrane-bound dehydrogenase-like protein